jgi:hypothetical protein
MQLATDLFGLRIDDAVAPRNTDWRKKTALSIFFDTD